MKFLSWLCIPALMLSGWSSCRVHEMERALISVRAEAEAARQSVVETHNELSRQIDEQSTASFRREVRDNVSRKGYEKSLHHDLEYLGVVLSQRGIHWRFNVPNEER